MSFDDMKTLPHVIKPFTLFLVILQMIFLFSPSYKDFGWFPMTTTILMLIVSTIVFVFFALDVAIVTRSPYWPLAELIYAGVFAVSSAINTFYFFFNIFTPFNFWFVLGTGSSVLICLTSAFDAYLWHRERLSPSFNSSNNQATAQPGVPPQTTGYPFPSGANPA